METQSSLFTWEALSAMGGASLLTFFIVQYTKALVDKFVPSLPTDLYAVLVAWCVLSAAQLALGAALLDLKVYGLAFANAFLVAAAAGQMQNKSVNAPGTKSKDGDSTNNG